MVDMYPPVHGVPADLFAHPGNCTNIDINYIMSKTLNWFFARESALREGKPKDVVILAVNPGSYTSEVWRTTPKLLVKIFCFFGLLSDPAKGYLTYFWAGFSRNVTMKHAVEGCYGMPNGRWHPGQRGDLVQAMKREEEGGLGRAEALYDDLPTRLAQFLKGADAPGSEGK